MSGLHRPHVLGVDDGPVEKRIRRAVPLVGVTMEGSDLGEAVTGFLADWIEPLRVAHPIARAIAMGQSRGRP